MPGKDNTIELSNLYDMVLRYQRARSWHSWESIISVDDSSAVQPFQAPLFPWRNSYMSTNRDGETNEINALLWSTKKWQQTEKSQQIEKTAPKLWQQASKPGDIALYGCCLAALRDKYWLFSIVRVVVLLFSLQLASKQALTPMPGESSVQLGTWEDAFHINTAKHF